MMFFGRPVAHPTDTFIRNVALLSLLLLGGILLYNRVTTVHARAGRSPEKTKVTCWTPAHFYDAANDYTNHFCRETDTKYKPFNPDLINQNDSFRTEVDLPAGTNAWNSSSGSFFELVTATKLEVYMTAQAVVVVVAYLLLRNVACRAATQARILAAGVGGSSLQQAAAWGLKRSYCTTVTYVIIEVCYFIAMLVFFGQLRKLPTAMWTTAGPTESKSAVFLCDFQMRVLTNVQHYTVTCFGTTPAVGPELQTGLPQLVLYLDTALCGAVALMLLLHIIQTLLITPASSDTVAAYEISKSPSFPGSILFGCSDMNLAAIFVNLIGQSQVIRVGQPSLEGGETFKQPENMMNV